MNGMMRSIGQTVAAVAVAAALLVGSGLGNGAGAERVPTGGDSAQRGCRMLQDRVIDLIAQYGSASPAEQELLLGQLRNLGSDWIAIGCRYAFGSIVKVAPGMLGGVPGFVGADLSPDTGGKPGVPGQTTGSDSVGPSGGDGTGTVVVTPDDNQPVVVSRPGKGKQPGNHKHGGKPGKHGGKGKR